MRELSTPVYEKYDRDLLLKKVEPLKIKSYPFVDEKKGERQRIVTSYDKRITHEYEVSPKYGLFDFKRFVKGNIELFEDNFPIKEYKLTLLDGGFQNLAFNGDVLNIGKEIFKTQLSITSSSNGSGLYRINR